MRFLISERTISHMDRDLVNMGGVLAPEYDFSPKTALQIKQYAPSFCSFVNAILTWTFIQFILRNLSNGLLAHCEPFQLLF